MAAPAFLIPVQRAADDEPRHALGLPPHARGSRPAPLVAVPCEVCAVAVAYGFPHTSTCTSEDAVAHRSYVVPQLSPEG